jgi:hypothetical protein
VCANDVVVYWLACRVVWRVVISGVCQRCCAVLAGGSCGLAWCNAQCVSTLSCLAGRVVWGVVIHSVRQRCCGVLQHPKQHGPPDTIALTHIAHYTTPNHTTRQLTQHNSVDTHRILQHAKPHDTPANTPQHRWHTPGITTHKRLANTPQQR